MLSNDHRKNIGTSLMFSFVVSMDFYYTSKSVLIYLETSIGHGKWHRGRGGGGGSKMVLSLKYIRYYTIRLKQKALFTIFKKL